MTSGRSLNDTLTLRELVEAACSQWRMLALLAALSVLITLVSPGLAGLNYEAAVTVLFDLPSEDAETTVYHVTDQSFLRDVIARHGLRTTPALLAGRLRVVNISKGVSKGVRIAVLAATPREGQMIAEALAAQVQVVQAPAIAQARASLEAAHARFLAQTPEVLAELRVIREQMAAIRADTMPLDARFQQLMPQLLQETLPLKTKVGELRDELRQAHLRYPEYASELETASVTFEQLHNALGHSVNQLEELSPRLGQQIRTMEATLDRLSSNLYRDPAWTGLLGASGIKVQNLEGLIGAEQEAVNIDTMLQSLAPRIIHTQVRALSPWPVQVRHAAAAVALTLVVSLPLVAFLEYLKRTRTAGARTPSAVPPQPGPAAAAPAGSHG